MWDAHHTKDHKMKQLEKNRKRKATTNKKNKRCAFFLFSYHANGRSFCEERTPISNSNAHHGKVDVASDEFGKIYASRIKAFSPAVSVAPWLDDLLNRTKIYLPDSFLGL